MPIVSDPDQRQATGPARKKRSSAESIGGEVKVKTLEEIREEKRRRKAESIGGGSSSTVTEAPQPQAQEGVLPGQLAWAL